MKSTKKDIQKIAAYSFRKKGYQATSMRHIADEVGIKAPSIYNHYKKKHLLLEDLLMNVAQQFSTGMKSIKSESISSLEKMEKVIQLHVQLTVEHTDAIALITNEWVHLEKPALEKYIKLRDNYEKDFKSIIRKGKKTGEFKDVNIDLAMFSILSTLRWLYSWYSKNKKFNQTKLKNEMIKCLLDGIK